MASWRDSLFKASFRGVPFVVEGDDTGGIGRRRIEHLYPGRDELGSEDVGLHPREYRLTALVIGADFAAQRDRLIEALEKAGPGTLVHPYLGEMQVEVSKPATVRHSSSEGRMAHIDMTFAPAGAPVRPRAAADTLRDVSVGADAADVAIQTSLEKTLQTAGQPGWIADDARTVLGELSAKLDAAARAAGLPAAKLSAYMGDAKSLKDDLSSLILKPALLAGRLSAQFRGLLGGDPTATWRSANRLSGFAPSLPAIPLTTPTRLVQANNRAALTSAAQRLALITSARAVVAVPFESAQETEAAAAAMAEALDRSMMTAPDEVFEALADLRAAVTRDLAVRAAQRPKLLTIHAAVTQPALLLANTLFGDDPSRAPVKAAEICRRNGIKHPLFVPGGVDLEVLGNA